MKRFEDILCVVDAAQSALTALERAVLLAENNSARLTVVDVVDSPISFIEMPEGGLSVTDLQEGMIGVSIQRLENLIAPFRNRIQIQPRVLKGKPFLAIIREVIRNHHDLVVKIPETQDWMGRFFGNDDMHLLRKCPCPVWLTKTASRKSYRCILAAVDVDTEYPPEELNTRHALNRQVLEMAASLAISDFAELHVVHAWHASGESMMHGAFMRITHDKVIAYVEESRRRYAARLDALLGEVAGHLGKEALEYLDPRIHLIKGSASREIPAQVKRIEAELVVMGTVGRTGIPGFIIGNTAETILNQIDCSVLAIKPPGFQTPVTAREGMRDEIY